MELRTRKSLYYIASSEFAERGLIGEVGVQSNKIYGQVTLEPFESRILVSAACEIPTPAFP